MTTLDLTLYRLLKTVPRGKVTTYKELARAAGTTAYRAVGQAMRRNPYAPGVPCHRVVSSTGKLGGFMGKTQGQELQKKIGLLSAEGVKVLHGKIVDFDTVLYTFPAHPRQ